VHDDAHDLIIEIVLNFPIVHAALINTTARSFRSSHSIAVFREAIAAEQIVPMPSDALPKFPRRGSTSARHKNVAAGIRGAAPKKRQGWVGGFLLLGLTKPC
jgi:hypothetical protein